MLGWIAAGAGMALSAWLGSRSQPKPPKLPTPPAPIPAPRVEEQMRVVDKINGVETFMARGADGKYRKVISRLPRSKEEEETMQYATQLISSTMKNLHALYQQDPDAAPDYAPLIETFANLNEERTKDLAEIMGGDIPTQRKFTEEVNAFKAMQSNILEDAFKKEQNRLGEELIQNGHLDSSAATEMRAHLAKQKALASAQVNANAELYGRDLADKAFARDMTIYGAEQDQKLRDFGLREQARQQQLQKEGLEYDVKSQAKDRAFGRARDLYGMASNVVDRDLAKVQASMAPQMSMNNFGQRLQSHQAQVMQRQQAFQNALGVKQQAFQNRLATPSFGETMAKIGMHASGNYLGKQMFAASDKKKSKNRIPSYLADNNEPSRYGLGMYGGYDMSHLWK